MAAFRPRSLAGTDGLGCPRSIRGLRTLRPPCQPDRGASRIKVGAGLCVRRAQRPERGKRTPLIGHEVSRLGGTEAAAPRHHPPAHYGSQTAPPERSERGFPHEAPMLILLAMILAASLIAMQAAGLWVGL